MENYGEVKRFYQQVAAVDPQLAERYNYLQMGREEAARASDSGQIADRVLWEE
jgi:hypothetical protein